MRVGKRLLEPLGRFCTLRPGAKDATLDARLLPSGEMSLDHGAPVETRPVLVRSPSVIAQCRWQPPSQSADPESHSGPRRQLVRLERSRRRAPRPLLPDSAAASCAPLAFGTSTRGNSAITCHAARGRYACAP